MLKFKHKRDQEMFSFLHPVLIMIYMDMVIYAKDKHGVDLVCTSHISTPDIDKKLKRSSTSHLTRRAIDIRTKDLNAFIVNDLVDYVNNKTDYGKYKYVSKSGDRRLAFFHIGSHQHIHLQLHSRFSLPPLASNN